MKKQLFIIGPIVISTLLIAAIVTPGCVPSQNLQQKQEQKQVTLRSTPTLNLTDDAVRVMMKLHNFFCNDNSWSNKRKCVYRNPKGTGIHNNYEKRSKDGSEVLIDHTSGLMWQHSGSEEITYEGAKQYIQKINTEKYAGHDDWRLPTLEEGMSLMKPTTNKDALYIDPLFDKQQVWIWTSDTTPSINGASSAWVVSFKWGYCNSTHGDMFNNLFVRAVRRE